MRELDRERVKMEQQEKKLIADIKKMAKQGQLMSRRPTATQSLSCVLKASIKCTHFLSFLS